MNRREIIVSALLALACVIALIAAVGSLHKKTGQHGMRGVITEKQFTPMRETQITIGSKGVDARHREGEYRFTVRVKESGRDYHVWVDKRVYDEHREGDSYFFLRPPAPPSESNR